MTAHSDPRPPLLEIRNLKKYYPVRSGVFSRVSAWVKAVDDVSFVIQPQETFGLVGESGCGKTTVGRTLLRLIEPTAGEIFFNGQDFCQFNAAQVRALRRRMQMIFQDPYSSLNPRMTVGAIIGEALKVHDLAQGDELVQQVNSLLERVGLSPTYHSRYPHEFSGGQRQRIGIARALYHDPAVLVLDEATSSLDMDTERDLMEAVRVLRGDKTILIVAHRFSTVEHCDYLYRLDKGKVVEEGKTAVVLGNITA